MIKYLNKLKLNSDELIFDLVVLFFILIFRNSITYAGRIFIEEQGYYGVFVLLILIGFFISSQLGVVTGRYKVGNNGGFNPKKSTFRFSYKSFLMFTVWLVAGFTMFIVFISPALINLERYAKEYIAFAIYGAAGYLLYYGGIQTGYLAVTKSAQVAFKNITFKFFIASSLAFSLLVLIKPCFIYLMLKSFVKLSEMYLDLLSMLGLTIVIALIILLFYFKFIIIPGFLFKIIERYGILKNALKISIMILMTLSILQWQGILSYHFKQTGYSLYWGLVFSGYLPFRTLLALAPPQNKINMFVGFIIIVFDILSV